MASGVASNVRIAFLSAGPYGAKVGLDDLYCACNRDANVFKQTLLAACRPTNPEEVVGWLKDRWASWSEAQQYIEFRRAIALTSCLLPSAEFETSGSRCHQGAAHSNKTAQGDHQVEQEGQSEGHQSHAECGLDGGTWLHGL